MKYSIVVQTLINAQPPHLFVQHKGIAEGKVERLFREVVQEQYDRLERGRPAEYLVDVRHGEYAVTMSRLFECGAITTVTIVAVPAAELQGYIESESVN